MEEDTRPLTERDKQILKEVRKVQKLRREQGCRLLDCNVVINNTNLRIEIIDLKRKMREQEEHIEEYKLNVKEAMHEAQENARIFRKEQEKANKYKKIIELMAEQLAVYKFEEIICMETECEHVELQNEGKCIGDKACILEYFEKKVRGK